MPASLLNRILHNRRAVVTFLTALLGLLVAFGVPITPAQQHILLALIGLIFSFITGDAYVQGKAVEAAARQASDQPIADALRTLAPSVQAVLQAAQSNLSPPMVRVTPAPQTPTPPQTPQAPQ